MNDEQLWTRWSEIYEENKKVEKEPTKPGPMVQIMKDFDVVVSMSVGLETSPKLGSQQQMKVRKMCDRFADEMVMLSDPDVAIKLADEIYYNGLKQRMMDKMKNE